MPASVSDFESEKKECLCTVQEFLKAILDGKEPKGLLTPEPSGRTRVLCYVGSRLSPKRKEELHALAADSSGKDLWLAFNEFQNADMGKSLAHIVPRSSFLLLKPCPKDYILSFGKKECRKYLGSAAFDEVIITSVDYVEILKDILPLSVVKEGRRLRRAGRKILQKCKSMFQKP